MSDGDVIDFDAVEVFVGLAREAQERGDQAGLIAVRKLVLIALGVVDTPPPRFNTKHLRPTAG